MSDLYTALVARCLFPLQELAKGHSTVAVRRKLEASQWWPASKIAALQLERLQRLLANVAARNRYYRELFRSSGFDVASVTSLDDLTRLPFLTKAAIKAHLDDFKSEGATRLQRSNTGGSSGEPLVFYMGPDRVSHDVAAKWRATRWWGVDIGSPEIVVWGSPIELGAQDIARRLRDLALRTTLLSAFAMSEAKLDEFVARIRAVKPKMLFGYPSALSLIARHAERRRVRMDDLGVAVAFVTAERLYDDQRDIIAHVFGCPVANGYGGRDAGFIAHECPQGGMHVTAEDVIVEIVDERGQRVEAGNPGEIVITHLATEDFPFIRYRTGDIGAVDTRICRCGRGLPLLKSIDGRSTDFVIAADGTVLHGLALIYVLRALPGIDQFKIVQESIDVTRVEVVPGAGYGDVVKDEIVRGLRSRLGSTVRVEVEEVTTIAAESSGKHRYVKSNVARHVPAVAGGVPARMATPSA